MSIENKYRVHEVAKDFGVDTKDITDVMAEYFTAPKNHMQVLENDELNLIFDYMTKQHPVDNMEEVLNKQAVRSRSATQSRKLRSRKARSRSSTLPLQRKRSSTTTRRRTIVRQSRMSSARFCVRRAPARRQRLPLRPRSTSSRRASRFTASIPAAQAMSIWIVTTTALTRWFRRRLTA